MAKTLLRTASVLAFERKLANSDALMFAGNWAQMGEDHGWRPIAITSKDVRGTISNRLKNAIASDPAKLDAEIQKANLQRVDFAALPFDADTLRVSFTLRVLGNLARPSACNDQAYQTALAHKIDTYIAEHKFSVLAGRYAENIANGRYLWRNRLGAEAISVRVSQKFSDNEIQTWVFDGLARDLGTFESPTGDLASLAEAIRQGLTGESSTFLQIDAYARVGVGQEVFPSQELVLDAAGRDSRKSKY